MFILVRGRHRARVIQDTQPRDQIAVLLTTVLQITVDAPKTAFILALDRQLVLATPAISPLVVIVQQKIIVL